MLSATLTTSERNFCDVEGRSARLRNPNSDCNFHHKKVIYNFTVIFFYHISSNLPSVSHSYLRPKCASPMVQNKSMISVLSTKSIRLRTHSSVPVKVVFRGKRLTSLTFDGVLILKTFVCELDAVMRGQ